MQKKERLSRPKKREVKHAQPLKNNIPSQAGRSECRVDAFQAALQGASESDFDDNIPLAELKVEIRCKNKKRNRKKLLTLASACDRYVVSCRAAAAIASPVLHDFGLVSKEDSFNVIDRNKNR